jgi:hypothetical protein
VELESVIKDTEGRLSRIAEEMEFRNGRLKRIKKA